MVWKYTCYTLNIHEVERVVNTTLKCKAYSLDFDCYHSKYATSPSLNEMYVQNLDM